MMRRAASAARRRSRLTSNLARRRTTCAFAVPWSRPAQRAPSTGNSPTLAWLPYTSKADRGRAANPARVWRHRSPQQFYARTVPPLGPGSSRALRSQQRSLFALGNWAARLLLIAPPPHHGSGKAAGGTGSIGQPRSYGFCSRARLRQEVPVHEMQASSSVARHRLAPSELRANPSVEARPNGGPPGPRSREAYHRPRGPGVPPSAPPHSNVRRRSNALPPQPHGSQRHATVAHGSGHRHGLVPNRRPLQQTLSPDDEQFRSGCVLLNPCVPQAGMKPACCC